MTNFDHFRINAYFGAI